jgi:hypothetical protein
MQMVKKIMHTERGLVPGIWFEWAGNATHANKERYGPLQH